jgi:hypothetical protein
MRKIDTVTSWIRVDPTLAGILERTSRAIARLDQALDGHPLLPAFLYRARLEAVRRQAAVDGLLIDPWHHAAVLEGFRLRMDHAMRIIDRGVIFDAARHALTLHQWLTVPDFDQEGEVQQAEAALETPEARASPLLSVALGVHAWLDRDGMRPPIRAALVRYWTRHRLFRAPVPLTGVTALRAETPWAIDAWVPIFLTALADEADDASTDASRHGTRLVRCPTGCERAAEQLTRRHRHRHAGRRPVDLREITRHGARNGGEERAGAFGRLLRGRNHH